VVVGLIVLGPQKLPGLFRTIGQWISQLRRFTTEVRAQTGIDEILRAEGLQGGLTELRGMMRAEHPVPIDTIQAPSRSDQPPQYFGYDISRERPVEGPDCYDAIAEDLSPIAEEPGVVSNE
jgi:hypothetical protein